MIPMAPAPKAAATIEMKSLQKGEPGSGNFSRYMEKKMAAERQEKQNLLGSRAQKAAQAPRADKNQQARSRQEEASEDEAVTIASLLGQFVAELKEAAGETGTKAGEWAFSVPDASAIQKIAQDAGMTEAQLAQLMEQLENQDGEFGLVDFLEMFSRHFASMQDQQPVAVPETELPFLDSLLERLGISPEELKQIGEAAVAGDNTLDLEKFLEGLKSIDQEGITSLSDWEAEQLQNLLAEAGVSEAQQRALLPERFPTWQDPNLEGQTVDLTLSRLKNMLEQGVADAKANRLQADLPAFLADLDSLLSQAGFEEQGAGWTPAVQESVTAVFDKLMESVDLSKVSVQKAPADSNTFKKSEVQAVGEEDEETWEETIKAAGDSDSEAAIVRNKENPARQNQGKAGEQGHKGEPALGFGKAAEQAGVATEHVQRTDSASPAQQAVEAAAPATETRNSVPTPRMPLEVQQQTFNQINQGVLQGLKNQEHHLVMKLYPKELGEVKVELLVRNEQVAVSFAMENSKVKETLESNMEQFKENMAEKGFILEECMVSLNKGDDQNEAWQKFEQAWKANAPVRKESLADLPENALYLRPAHSQTGNKGIDLFA